jgi:hypothetical protein
MIESYSACAQDACAKAGLPKPGRMHSFIEVIKREKCEWGDGLGAVGDTIAALKEG